MAMTITVAADCTSVTLAGPVLAALGPLGVKSSGVLTATNIQDLDTVTIDGKVYQFQDTLTNVDGNVAITGLVAATGILQIVGQPADTNTVVIDGKTYTYQTILTNVDGNVQIGGTSALSRANLVAAINLTGTPGTDYALATTIHPTVNATDSNPNMTVNYNQAGEIGNGASTTETVAGWSWVAPTMNGGTNDIPATLINLRYAIELGAGAGTAYAAAMTLHPTVEYTGGVHASNVIPVQAKTSGTAGDLIATTETGGSMSWAQVTLTGGVDEGTYTAIDVTATTAAGVTTTNNIVLADLTGSDYIVLPAFFTATGTIPTGFYNFTVTSTAPILTGTETNCAMVDCDLLCEVYDQVLVNLKRPSALRTEYHLMYQSLLNVAGCESCDCTAHLDMYELIKRDVNNPTLLDQDDCGCS